MIKIIWKRWKTLAEKIGSINATLIFSLLYYFLIVPMGLIVRLVSDYLEVKQPPKWSKIAKNPQTIAELAEQ